MRARILTAAGGSFTIGWTLAGLIAMGVVPHFGWRTVLLIGILPVLLIPALRAYLPESVRFLGVKNRYPHAIGEIERIEKLGRIEPRTWSRDAFTQAGPLSQSLVPVFRKPQMFLLKIQDPMTAECFIAKVEL